MKIYTEFELAKAYDKGLHDGIFSHISSKSKDTAMKELKPIELPSDEEIKQYSIGYALVNEDVSDKLDNYLVSAIHIDGAMWLKKQILNQNK